MRELSLNELEWKGDRQMRLVSIEDDRDGRRENDEFHASDMLKPNLDIYWSFTEEPKTNPPTWNETLKWGAGLGVEAQILMIMKQCGWVADSYDQEEEDMMIKREGIKVSCHADAIHVDGFPIEIKSVNNKNYYDIKNYREGNPRENYVAQLAVYMDALGKERGYLFVATVDGLDYFLMPCFKIGEGVYKCGNVEVNIYDEYKRFAKLYEENIKPKKLPDIWQYRYKYDLNDIDWRELPNSQISKARTNKRVIGDWQVQYSDWKDKIIELQGTTPGYTDEEIELINELTDGYTTWK